MMNIYTSYFGRINILQSNGIVPINVALWKPKWYNGLSLYIVAPKGFMLRSQTITQEEYIDCYNRLVLSTLNAHKVLKDISVLSCGKDAALICYEKPGDFCHRHLLADWLSKNGGVQIEEWGNGINLEEKKEKKPIQLSLF